MDPIALHRRLIVGSLNDGLLALEKEPIREIVPLADFCPLLGLAQGPISDLFRVIVLGTERAEFGVPADAVHHTRVSIDDSR